MPERIAYHRSSAAKAAAGDYHGNADRREGILFYTSARWRKLRRAFLAENPLCAACQRNGLVTPASDVHHKQERRDYPDLAFDWDNLESLCRSCHNAARSETGQASRAGPISSAISHSLDEM